MVWPHALTDRGYGAVTIYGRPHRVHRVVYEAAHGPLAPGVLLRHTCDNRACARLDHLLPGTPAENTADMLARDRAAKGVRNARARLTDDDVRAIRVATGTQAEIGRRFGIPRSQAGKIRRGEAWAHVV